MQGEHNSFACSTIRKYTAWILHQSIDLPTYLTITPHHSRPAVFRQKHQAQSHVLYNHKRYLNSVFRVLIALSVYLTGV